MFKKIFIILIFTVSCSFAMVSSHDGEIDYDKMIVEGRQKKQYTRSEIIEIENARREAKNARVRQTMDSFARPRVSKVYRKTDKATDKSNGHIRGVFKANTIVAIIILIFGGFMLLYAYSLFSRKRVDKV